MWLYKFNVISEILVLIFQLITVFGEDTNHGSNSEILVSIFQSCCGW